MHEQQNAVGDILHGLSCVLLQPIRAQYLDNLDLREFYTPVPTCRLTHIPLQRWVRQRVTVTIHWSSLQSGRSLWAMLRSWWEESQYWTKGNSRRERLLFPWVCRHPSCRSYSVSVMIEHTSNLSTVLGIMTENPVINQPGYQICIWCLYLKW